VKRTEINRIALRAAIRAAYGIRLDHLAEIAQGEVTANLRGQTADGASYLIKWYPASRLADISAARLDYVLPLLAELHGKGLFPRVSVPVPTLEGALRATFAGRPLVLLRWIAGRVWSELPALPAGFWAKLGRVAARIHLSTPRLTTPGIPVEWFDIPFAADLWRGMAALAAVRPTDRPGRWALRELLLPRRDELQRIATRLCELQAWARARPLTRVLCHTDLTPGNIIVDDAGELHVVDWEGSMLAPAEHDLMFLTGDHFAEALAAYVSLRPQARLHADLFSFYFHRRNLEDLTDWLTRILYENTTDEQDRADLTGIQEDCLAWWADLNAGDQLREQIAPYAGPEA